MIKKETVIGKPVRFEKDKHLRAEEKNEIINWPDTGSGTKNEQGKRENQ